MHILRTANVHAEASSAGNGNTFQGASSKRAACSFVPCVKLEIFQHNISQTLHTHKHTHTQRPHEYTVCAVYSDLYSQSVEFLSRRNAHTDVTLHLSDFDTDRTERGRGGGDRTGGGGGTSRRQSKVECERQCWRILISLTQAISRQAPAGPDCSMPSGGRTQVLALSG